MHTTEELASADFAIAIDGAPASVESLFPGFTELDRLGVVVRTGFGAVGASTLILAAVTAFYDRLRLAGDDFFAYADYFVFHVGERRGRHGKLDVWPDHKEVVVPAVAEEILRAVNDRGVTRLLVEDRAPGEPALEPDTRASAERRIATCVAYSPAGRVAGADVTIAGSGTTESYVRALLGSDGAAVAAARGSLLEAGRPVETFRRIGLPEALRRL
jgi:hypothetical protein